MGNEIAVVVRPEGEVRHMDRELICEFDRQIFARANCRFDPAGLPAKHNFSEPGRSLYPYAAVAIGPPLGSEQVPTRRVVHVHSMFVGKQELDAAQRVAPARLLAHDVGHRFSLLYLYPFTLREGTRLRFQSRTSYPRRSRYPRLLRERGKCWDLMIERRMYQ